MELNKNEMILKDVIQEAEKCVSCDKELEIVHWFDPEDGEPGYYAYEYDGDQSVPIYANDYYKQALITDENIERFNIDIIKVLDACGVYYSEC